MLRYIAALLIVAGLGVAHAQASGPTATDCMHLATQGASGVSATLCQQRGQWFTVDEAANPETLARVRSGITDWRAGRTWTGAHRCMIARLGSEATQAARRFGVERNLSPNEMMELNDCNVAGLFVQIVDPPTQDDATRLNEFWLAVLVEELERSTAKADQLACKVLGDSGDPAARGCPAP